jgi:hypothetical protein
VPRFEAKGDKVSAIGDDGKTLISVPIREPVMVRDAMDEERGVPRMNVN